MVARRSPRSSQLIGTPQRPAASRRPTEVTPGAHLRPQRVDQRRRGLLHRARRGHPDVELLCAAGGDDGGGHEDDDEHGLAIASYYG